MALGQDQIERSRCHACASGNIRPALPRLFVRAPAMSWRRCRCGVALAQQPPERITMTDSNIDRYMASVTRHRVLTRHEEHALAVRARRGDRAASDKLAASNLRLVVKIAREYHGPYPNLADLVQEGNIGLVKAVRGFDPERGFRLSTYAGRWIRAHILQRILMDFRLVKIAKTHRQRRLFYNLRRTKAALKAAGVEPTAAKLAELLDARESDVVDMDMRMGAPDASLDAPLEGGEGDSSTRLDLVAAPEVLPEPPADMDAFKSLLTSKLAEFGSGLVGRDAEAFQGLLSDDPPSLRQLGDQWGVTRERARQVQKHLLARIREHLQNELGGVPATP